MWPFAFAKPWFDEEFASALPKHVETDLSSGSVSGISS